MINDKFIFKKYLQTCKLTLN